MQFQEFFAHNHASYALDSLIKGLFMLIKNDSNDIIVKEALSLLIVILHGYVIVKHYHVCRINDIFFLQIWQT